MKKVFTLTALMFVLMPLISLNAVGWTGNMYEDSYYNTTYSTTTGGYAFAQMKNLDNYDDGVGSVYMQNYMDIHGNWITQCSAVNQKVSRGKQISCDVASAMSYDGRTRGIYTDIPTGGLYIYSHLE